jgi:hypothetical protein
VGTVTITGISRIVVWDCGGFKKILNADKVFAEAEDTAFAKAATKGRVHIVNLDIMSV